MIFISIFIQIALFIIRWIIEANLLSATQREKLVKAVSACAALQMTARQKHGIEPSAELLRSYLEKAKKAKEPSVFGGKRKA